MTTETPTFWLSPDCDETGLFACPKCKEAHRHSLPEDGAPSHRVAHCADFFNEVVRKLNANSKETGTAVLMDFEFERSQCVRALLDDLQRQSHGAPGTSGVSTYPGKRKASEYETQTKVAKRPHPEGVCKFWAGTGRCKYSADDCTA